MGVISHSCFVLWSGVRKIIIVCYTLTQFVPQNGRGWAEPNREQGPVYGTLFSACYKEVEHVGGLSTVEKLHRLSCREKGML